MLLPKKQSMSKQIDLNNKRVLISRTDSIGDVVLTLPLCSWLKQKFPSVRIVFLGNSYTKPVLDCFDSIDEVEVVTDWEQMPVSSRVDHLRSLKIDAFIHVFPTKELASLAKKAKVPFRIGTSHRSFHLLTCNIRLNFSRKNSDFHESQLNFELLRPFGIDTLPELDEITNLYSHFKIPEISLPKVIEEKLSNERHKIILHPKSQGSAVEWPIEKYVELTKKLNSFGIQVFFTGTEKEGVQFRGYLPSHELCVDTSGKMSLSELIAFIGHCDGLVACSTGPLHLAGINNKLTIGLFSPKRPIHPGRWKALGNHVHILVNDVECPTCKKKKACSCIELISVERVEQEIKRHFEIS